MKEDTKTNIYLAAITTPIYRLTRPDRHRLDDCSGSRQRTGSHYVDTGSRSVRITNINRQASQLRQDNYTGVWYIRAGKGANGFESGARFCAGEKSLAEQSLRRKLRGLQSDLLGDGGR